MGSGLPLRGPRNDGFGAWIRPRALFALLSVLCLLVAVIGPARALQDPLTTPGAPLPMSGLATFINNALESVGSCNSGASAPTNGPGGVPFTGQCWLNTTGTSWPLQTYDGSSWVEIGQINSSTHAFSVPTGVLPSPLLTLGSTALTPGGTISSVSGLTLSSPTLSGTLGGSGAWGASPIGLAYGGLGGSQSGAAANTIPVYPGSGGAATPTAFATFLSNLCSSSIGQYWVQLTGGWGCTSLGWLNPVWWGADPTGGSSSAAAFNSAISVAQGSDLPILIPCGTYNIGTTGLNYAFPAGLHFAGISGLGPPGCARLKWTGAVSGVALKLSLQSITSSAVAVHNLMLLTAVASGGTCLELYNPTLQLNPAASLTNYLDNVTCQGADGPAGTDYWTTNLVTDNISNFNSRGFTYYGSNASQGIGINLSNSANTANSCSGGGVSGSTTFNFTDTIGFFVATAFEITGACIQGVVLEKPNFIAGTCFSIPANLGGLDYIGISLPQCNFSTYGINALSGAGAGFQAKGGVWFNGYGTLNSIGMRFDGGAYWYVDHATIAGTSTTDSSVGLVVGDTAVTTQVFFDNNNIQNFAIAANLYSGAAYVYFHHDQLFNNGATIVNSGANNIYFDDNYGASCIVCSSVPSSVATGIDISAYSISGNAFRSPGYVLTGAGAAYFGGLNLSGYTMVTNPGNNGLWGVLVQDVTGSNSQVESALTVDMNATHSCTLSLSNGHCNKIALYSGIQCASGNTACWAENPIINIGASPSSNFQVAIGDEIDLNNGSGTNFGTYTGPWNNTSTGAGCPGSAGGGGTYNCYVGGLIVTGQGGSPPGGTVDFGIAIDGTGPAGAPYNGAFWNRGFVASAGIYQHAFEDGSSAQVSYAMYGSHTYGIDTAGATISTAAMRMGNAQWISARNAANSADIDMITVSAANFVVLGGGTYSGILLGSAATSVFSFGNFYPQASNTYSLGNGSNIWSGVYAVTHYGGTGASAGVNCSGPTTSSFAAQGGVVTHC